MAIFVFLGTGWVFILLAAYHAIRDALGLESIW